MISLYAISFVIAQEIVYPHAGEISFLVWDTEHSSLLKYFAARKQEAGSLILLIKMQGNVYPQGS